MIVLMLHGPAEQLFALVFDELSVEIVGANFDLLGPAHFGVQPGQAEAALFVLARRMSLDDLWVDEDELLVFLLGVGIALLGLSLAFTDWVLSLQPGVTERNVKRIRQEKGLTQEQLAELAGFSQQYISGLEQGRRNPTIVSIYELATALGVSHMELVRSAADE